MEFMLCIYAAMRSEQIELMMMTCDCDSVRAER